MVDIDSLITKYLTEKASGPDFRRSKKCPSEAELDAYLQGLASGPKTDKISQHISQCLFCLQAIEQAGRQDMSIRESGPPKQAVERAKAIAKQRAIGLQRRKYLWLAGAAISFALSFFFPKYFFQFLILTLILGIKWALDSANTRTLIMVQDVWRKQREKEEKGTN